MRAPPPPTLFPYTTLFRSDCEQVRERALGERQTGMGEPAKQRETREEAAGVRRERRTDAALETRPRVGGDQPPGEGRGDDERSEEHTSELQSRRDLVCRLL